MNTRQSAPWGTILGALALVLLAGAVGFWLGSHRGVLLRPHVGSGFGAFGLLALLLLALVVALAVGLIAAAATPRPEPPESYEEWHRRAHARDAMAHGGEGTERESAPAAGSDDETVT